jgi:hypothetical protein
MLIRFGFNGKQNKWQGFLRTCRARWTAHGNHKQSQAHSFMPYWFDFDEPALRTKVNDQTQG